MPKTYVVLELWTTENLKINSETIKDKKVSDFYSKHYVVGAAQDYNSPAFKKVERNDLHSKAAPYQGNTAGMNMGEASQDGHVNKGPTNLPNGAIYEGSWLGDQRDGFGI